MSYMLPLADRLIVVELTAAGTVRPFVQRRENGVVTVPDSLARLAELAAGQRATFEVSVPNQEERRNSGMVTHELSSWGPKEYLFTSAYFLGVTWPFGQEVATAGPSPMSPHTDKITYTFEQVARRFEGADVPVWNLRWMAEAGRTRADGSVDVVADGGGSCVYVVLRLAPGAQGSIKFRDLEFEGRTEF